MSGALFERAADPQQIFDLKGFPITGLEDAGHCLLPLPVGPGHPPGTESSAGLPWSSRSGHQQIPSSRSSSSVQGLFSNVQLVFKFPLLCPSPNVLSLQHFARPAAPPPVTWDSDRALQPVRCARTLSLPRSSAALRHSFPQIGNVETHRQDFGEVNGSAWILDLRWA